jgi:gliding motility-associated-like protein
VPVYIQALPIAAYTTDPDPLISGLPVNFTDASAFNVSPGAGWLYLFGDGTFDTEQNPTHTYPDPAIYEICLIITDDFGCIDTLCEMVSVAPAEIVAPNIVTANNDGVNDLLEFRYLEFYPDNQLSVINRWGNIVFETGGYLNDWNPIDHTEGTYYYLLKINGLDKEYSGFFQLVK